MRRATRRDHAEPTRHGRGRRDLQLAAQSSPGADARRVTARVALDAIRLAELLTLDTGDQLLGSVAGQPGAQPVSGRRRSEARARSSACARVARCDLDLHARSASDRAGARRRRSDTGAPKRRTTGEEASRAAWRALCDDIGVTGRPGRRRCSLPPIATRSRPASIRCSRSSRCRTRRRRSCRAPAVLPDRWIAIGIRDDGTRIVEHRRRADSDGSVRRLDTTPSETAALANREGEPIQLPPRMRWMTDFATGRAGRHGPRHSARRRRRSARPNCSICRSAADADTGPERRHARRPVHRSSVQPRLRVRPAEHTDEQQRGRRLRAAVAQPSASRPRSTSNGGRAHSHRAWPPTARPPRARSASPLMCSRPSPASGAASDVAQEPDGFEPEIAAGDADRAVAGDVGPALEDFLAASRSRART